MGVGLGHFVVLLCALISCTQLLHCIQVPTHYFIFLESLKFLLFPCFIDMITYLYLCLFLY